MVVSDFSRQKDYSSEEHRVDIVYICAGEPGLHEEQPPGQDPADQHGHGGQPHEGQGEEWRGGGK